jgi:YHS domain-containing protein
MILFLSAGLSLKTYSQEKSDEGKSETKTEQKSEENVAADDGKPFNTICPVSTEEADPEITHTYKGKTYALCCNNCLKKFKKDPGKYISRLSEDGKSIKKKKSE